MKNYKTVMLGSVATSALLLGSVAITSPALAKNVEVGHKKGSFYLKTKDGKFSVITGAQIQIQYEYNARGEDRAAGVAGVEQDSNTTSFTARRVRFGVKGRAGHKKLTYRVSMNISTNSTADQDGDGGGFAIFDTYLQWKFAKSLNLRAGTWKQRFTEAHSNGSGKAQMVEAPRGTENRARMERDTGLGINGKLFKIMSYELAVINGNTRKADANNSNQSFVGSVKLEPFGRFGAAYEGDIKNNKKLKVMVTAAAFYKDNVTFSTRTNQNTFISLAGEADIHGWTVGAGAKWRGFSLFGEYVTQRFIDADGETAAGHIKVAGERIVAWNVEGAYFIIPKKWSIAGRYEYHNVNTKSNQGGNTNAATQANGLNRGLQDETRFGMGTSYFFRGQAHKVVAQWEQIQDHDGSVLATGGNETSVDNIFRVQWQTRF
jgi:hypothetical protein